MKFQRARKIEVALAVSILAGAASALGVTSAASAYYGFAFGASAATYFIWLTAGIKRKRQFARARRQPSAGRGDS
jgi:hypothetical protein